MITDEEWVEQARARVARGEDWESPPGEAPFFPLPAAASKVAALRCPYCDGHPGLEPVPRFEVVSLEPLLRCPACYGFWAKGDALAHGVRDPYDDHPSFFAVTAPARCRACGGHLREDESCVKCGAKLALLNCPGCGVEMTRAKKDGVTLDFCKGCPAVWFDVGEIARVYNLAPPQSYAMSLVDEHALDGQPPEWQVALGILLRLFLPFV